MARLRRHLLEPRPLAVLACIAVAMGAGSCKRQPEAAEQTLQLSKTGHAQSEAAPAQSEAAPAQSEAAASSHGKPATAVEATGEQPKAFDLQPFIALSPEVLVGTDVTSLEQLSPSVGTVPESGTFRSEQGGASVRIVVTKEADVLTVERTYSEPGRREFSKAYQLRVSADEHSAAEGRAHLLALKDELLMLEQESGVDGFPEGMWLLYSPAKGAE